MTNPKNEPVAASVVPPAIEDGRLFDLLDEAATLIDGGAIAPSESMKCVYREVIHEAIRRLRAAPVVPPAHQMDLEPFKALARTHRFPTRDPFAESLSEAIFALIEEIEHLRAASVATEAPQQQDTKDDTATRGVKGVGCSSVGSTAAGNGAKQ